MLELTKPQITVIAKGWEYHHIDQNRVLSKR